ncbi:MAG: hypothetical protein H5T84_02645 [Thermoleophilia bacterium]|nr:hypothetical protein [Thermoleophilia bacterium]
MAKKEKRRVARQSFPSGKGAARGLSSRERSAAQRNRSTRSKGRKGRPALRRPTLKRAAIQGAILAVLYFIVIRFLWRQPETTTAQYVFFPLAGFVIYMGIAYAVDQFTYRRRLRKQRPSSK